MTWIRKILSLPIVKLILSSKVIKTILYILLLIAPFVALYHWWRKRKASKASKDSTEPAPLKPKELLHKWKAFYRQIPRQDRATIRKFTPFVVLGEAGNGKSKLIQLYTDWQGQSQQFYPSYHEDPIIQFYLGNQVLVQELSPRLLRDTTPACRKALLKLWRASLSHTPPKVVCVLKSTLLTTLPREELIQIAKEMRGKINLLSQIHRQPLEVRLVLTHMDQVDGFGEFLHFLSRHSLGLTLDLTKDLSSALEKYEVYLPLALTTLSARDFAKVLDFFDRFPQHLLLLQGFIEALQKEDPLSFRPELEKLYLTTSTNPLAESNPFAPDWKLPAREEAKVSARKRKIYATLTFLGLLYLGLGFLYEQKELYERSQEVEKLLLQYQKTGLSDQYRLVQSKLSQLRSLGDLSPYFPSFVRSLDNKLRQYEVQLATLKHYWQEKIEEKQRQQAKKMAAQLVQQIQEAKKRDQTVRVLLLLGLLHSRPNTALAKTIQSHLEVYSKEAELNQSWIRRFIHLSPHIDPPWISLKGLPPLSLEELQKRSAEEWKIFLLRWRDVLRRSLLTLEELVQLQQEAKGFQEDLQVRQRTGLLRQIYTYLEEHSDLLLEKTYALLQAARPFEEKLLSQSEKIQLFLQKVLHARLQVPQNLRHWREMLYYLQTLKEEQATEPIRLTFSLGDLRLTWREKLWSQLLRRSTAHLGLQKFLHAAEERGFWSLFPLGRAYGKVSLPVSPKSSYFFTMSHTLDRRYTSAVVSQEVKPIVLTWLKERQNFPLTLRDRETLESLLLRHLREYGQSWQRELQKFLLAFQLHTRSPMELRVALQILPRPASPLRQLFQILIETLPSLEREPFWKEFLNELRPMYLLKRTLTSQKGYAPIEEYFQILADLAKELSGLSPEKKPSSDQKNKEQPQSPSPPPPTTSSSQDASGLLQTLSPVGKIAYHNLSSPESYRTTVVRWLKQMAIPSPLWPLFLHPIHEATRLGAKDLERQVHLVWQKKFQPPLLDLFSAYPFQRESRKLLLPKKLTALLSPQSDFWKNLQLWLLPVLEERKGQFHLRQSLKPHIVLPPSCLALLNYAKKLSRTLWDREGKERPLLFHIRPKPLPAETIRHQRILLALFRTGHSRIMAFHQEPYWQTLQYRWWDDKGSQITLVLWDGKREKRGYRSWETKGPWSLYRLLDKGTSSDSLVWKFSIPPLRAWYAFDVAFEFRTSPWKVFTPPPIKSARKGKKP